MGAWHACPRNGIFVGLQKDERSLPPVRCESFGGWHFVNLDHDAVSLHEWLSPLDDILACLTIPSLRVPLDVKTAHVRCNWKIMAEGFLEVYHARTVHPATVAPTLSTKGTVITLYPHGHQSMVSPVVPGARTDGRDLLPMFEGASAAFQAMLQPAHGIFPNLITPLDGRGFPFLVFWPEAIDQTRLDIIWFVPDWGEGELPDKELWDRRLQRFDVLMQEDYRNLEPIQRSMEHAAPRRSGHQLPRATDLARARLDRQDHRAGANPAETAACPTCWRTGTICHETERSAVAGSGVVALQPAALRRLRRSGWRRGGSRFRGHRLVRRRPTSGCATRAGKAADIASAVTDHGLALAEVETVKGWWATQGPLADECLATEQLAYELADAAGVRYLQAIGPYECSIDQAAHGTAGLCDRVRSTNVKVGIEWLPYTNIGSAADAQRIVEAADRPNGGYCADIWHHVRGANDIEMVRQLPADKIFAVQMNDGPARPLIDD